MKSELPQIKKKSAFLIISCTLLILLGLDLAFVPTSSWIKLFTGKLSNLAVVLNPAVNYPVGTTPSFVFSGDFNNDGNLDLATANLSSNNVSILLGNNSGGFSSATNYNVGSGPNGITSADLNKDGKLDLVVTTSGSNSLSILLGNGDGTFTVTTGPNVNFYSSAIFAADLNNDGNADLVVANNSNFYPTTVLLGNGTGGFSPASTIIPVGRQYSVFAADFNNDGKLDLATANSSTNDISVLMGDGTGNFGAPNNFNVGTSPRYIYSADINNDGKSDLLVANYSSNDVSVLLGDGTGNFGTATNFSVGTNPKSVFAADFNGDGRKDLIVANNIDNNVSILLGDGTGNFGTATDFSVGTLPNSVLAADFNKDGKLDLVTANNNSNDVSVLLSIPDPSPSAYFSSLVNYPVSTNPQYESSADFNNDGKLDLAVANSGVNTVSILLGDGSGGFTSAPNLITISNPHAVFAADFNNDGKQDLAVANFSGGSDKVSIFLGNGSGGFTSAPDVLPSADPYSIFAADFNSDGKLDLAITERRNNFFLPRNSVHVFLGNGDGTFTPGASMNTGIFPYSVIAADLNNDGKKDLITANYGNSNLSVFFGNGNGTFGPITALIAGANPFSVIAVDLNNDGKQDLVVANNVGGSGSLSVLLNNGSGGFPVTTGIPGVGSAPYSVFAADLNNDGKQDLAVANSGSNNLAVLLGNGTGGFSATTSLNVGTNPQSVLAADFNNDGKLDLVSTNFGSNNISVLLGVTPNPIPTTINIDQTSKTVGDSSFTLTINGTNFINSSIVQFDGVLKPTTFISSTQLTANISSSDLTTSGTFPITVINPIYGSSATTTIDSYSESNYSGNSFNIFGSNLSGQSFSNTNNRTLDSVKFDLEISQYGSPTGNIYAKLYAITGTYGNNSTPTGPILATSDPVNASTLSTSYQLVKFNFSGANRVSLSANTKYALVLDCPSCIYSASPFVDNSIYLAYDNTSPTASGNSIQTTDGGTSWSGYSGGDVLFYVYGVNGNQSNPQTFTVNNPPPPPFNINSAVNYPAGSSPFSLITADFNNDGKQDLITSNSQRTFSLLTGNGDGTFTTQVTNTDLGTNSTSMVAADFNGDGKQDFAAANFNGNSVSIVLSNGNGTFSASSNFIANHPSGIFAADFNSDGKQDLAVVNGNGANTVSIFSGDGIGGFSLGSTYTVGNSQGIFAADLNNDGKKDLVVTNYDTSSASVLLGNGDGTFTSATNLTIGNSGPGHIFVADFNNDNKKDLAIVNRDSNNVSIFLGNGNGTFGTKKDFSVGNNPYDIFASDINNDGNMDLEVTNPIDNDVSVLLGYGNGSFASAINLSVGSRPESIVGTDFNNDGIQDLAVTNYSFGGVSIILGINPTPNPTLISITPTFKTAGDPQFTMTVDGTNFVSSSIVKFNGIARATTFVSSTELTAVIPSSDLTTTGTFPVTVVSPGGLISNPQLFVVNAPVPTTASISPAQKTVGNSQFTMTVDGTNFTNSSMVRLDGSDRTTTYVSPTELTAIIPATDMLTDGTFNITVFNPNLSGGDTSNGQVFTVVTNPSVPSAPHASPNPIPAVDNIGPTTKYVGDSEFTLTVNGSNFIPSSVARFNGSSRQTIYISSTQLGAKILNSDLLIPGSYSITVFNPAPGGGTSTN